jgi:hypothetical protein
MAEELEIAVVPNEPDPGDDPENRYDCDACAHAPAADEPIVLIIAKETEEVVDKFCVACAVEKLTAVPHT